MTRYHADPLIDSAIERAFQTHPYYASAIGRLRIVADERVPTMATSADWVTHYNPATVASWTVAERGAVLVHELEHLLRDHSGRCGDRDPQAWNVAADAEINERLANLPDGAVYPETLGMPRGRVAETYYGATGGGRKPDPQPGEGSGQSGEGSGSGSGGQSQPGEGSGAGKPGEGHGAAHCGSAAGGPTQDHERGDAANPGSGAANGGDDARKEVAEAVLGGWYPGTGEGSELREWAESQIGIDRAAWMRTLATVISRSMAAHGAPTRWQWPGRRDVRDMGGAMLPRWTGERPKVAVIIDTSSSITPADLDIARVAAVFLGKVADVTYWGCDTHPTRYGSSIPEYLGGGGGTQLRRGIDAAVADGARAIVIVTDCGTSWGTTAPDAQVIVAANIGARGILATPSSPWFPPEWATVVPITTD